MDMIKNKKGWIKIVEAFIAIILIASILLTIYAKPQRISNEEILKIEDSLLNEISQNEILRRDVMNSSNESIASFIQSRIPGNLNFIVKICSVDDVCGLDLYRKEVYSRERIISSSLQEYEPKKLKIFMWEK